MTEEESKAYKELFPHKCPECGGFMQYFKNEYRCRDCGNITAVYQNKAWQKPLKE